MGVFENVTPGLALLVAIRPPNEFVLSISSTQPQIITYFLLIQPTDKVKGPHNIYRPQQHLWKGNIFTSMSFCPRGVSTHCMQGYTTGHNPSGQTPPPSQTPPWADTPSPDGHCSGRYASYWNAFLFEICIG